MPDAERSVDEYRQGMAWGYCLIVFKIKNVRVPTSCTLTERSPLCTPRWE
jgi:hypothetical protein